MKSAMTELPSEIALAPAAAQALNLDVSTPERTGSEPMVEVNSA